MKESIKLSQWAKLHGYTYKGAYRSFLKGFIPNSYIMPSGSIMVQINPVIPQLENIVIYARVSSPKQKSDLETQINRLTQFCLAKGWKINNTYKEIASGLDDDRKILNKILDDSSITKIVVEHKDRLSRFGFNYIKRLLEQRNCEVYVVNETNSDQNDLIQDFVSIITSMTARIYGLRRSKRKTEQLIENLKNDSI